MKFLVLPLSALWLLCQSMLSYKFLWKLLILLGEEKKKENKAFGEQAMMVVVTVLCAAFNQ